MQKLVCLLLLAAPLVAAAQDTKAKKADAPPPAPAPAARGQLPPYYKRLGLSADQTEKVKKVRGEYRARVEALREQIRRLQAEEKEKLEAVLSADQVKRLRELRAGGPEKSKDGK